VKDIEQQEKIDVQTSLKLDGRDEFLQKSSDFIVFQHNEEIYNFITSFPKGWGNKSAILVGKKLSGKSYLATIFSEKADAVIIDFSKGIEPLSEIALNANKNFVLENIHLAKTEESQKIVLSIINYLKENDNYVFLTSAIAINKLELFIPDLESRLLSMLEFKINNNNLDIEFTIKFLAKEFSNYQIIVESKVLDYLAHRVNREVENLINITSILNEKSIEQKRKITIPFIKEVLEANKSFI